MQSFLTWLLTVNSHDEEVRRRGHNLIILILAMFGLGLFFLPTLLFNPQAVASLVIALVYGGIFFMARRGLVTPAALIFIVSLLLATLGSALSTGRLSVPPFYLLVPLLVASLTLRPWPIWLVLLFNAMGLTLTILALPYNPLTDPFDSQAVSSGFALLVVITLMSFLGAKSTNNALRGAEQARKEAEVAAQALERANASLETTVAERTRSLEAALQAVEQREARLVQTLAENELQRVTIREMSVPVIPVSTTTMVMPLIGALDTARLAVLRTQAIRSIERTGTRYLVLDITGVPIVNSQVAKGFLQRRDRSGGCPPACRYDARRLRDARGARYRERHDRSGATAPVRAVLYHQGAGARHGVGVGHVPRHRHRARRPLPCRQRGRPGHDGYALPAMLRATHRRGA